MKSYLMLIGLIFLAPLSSFSQQTVLNITTFNLKWFGIGGDPNSAKPEYRIKPVKGLLDTYLKNTSVFVFEEVVVVNDLLKLLPAGWQCLSYNHPEPQHQHVAICAVSSLSLERVSYDDNFTIEESTLGNARLRPAVRITVLERKSRRSLFTLVGLHLKAMPDQTSMRLAQVQEISKDLARIPMGQPIVITGDLNTFSKNETKLPEDDVDLILKGLNTFANGIVRVPHRPNTYTFRSPQFRNQLDHFYVRGSMRVTAIPDVFPVCSATQNGSGYLNAEYYYRNVSDHCPVTMQIVVN